jgi:hypothetical protein
MIVVSGHSRIETTPYPKPRTSRVVGGGIDGVSYYRG